MVDNVVFGERATPSAFLIFSGYFDHRCCICSTCGAELSSTIYIPNLKLQSEDSESDDGSKKVKDEHDNNVDKDNKDNIEKKIESN